MPSLQNGLFCRTKMAAGPLITLLPLLLPRAPLTRPPPAPGTPGNSTAPDKLVSTSTHFQLYSPSIEHEVHHTCSYNPGSNSHHTARFFELSVPPGSTARDDAHSVPALRRLCSPLLPSFS